MKITTKYHAKGTCSREIHVTLDGDTIESVAFIGGCNGNTRGVSKLVEGRNVDDVISLLRGIRCGLKSTSCPDQLSYALEAAKAELAKAQNDNQ